MRFFGLGAQVMQKLGVSTQLLAGADIYPALERGVIDATEFSMPTMDIELGFHQVAKFNYFPGWHQQISVNELLMNKEAWEALARPVPGDDRDRAAASTSCTTTPRPRRESRRHERDGRGVRRHRSVRWTDEQLAAFEKAWLEVLEEQSAAGPALQEGRRQLQRLPQEYKTWGDAQSLKPTYLDGVEP